ncbi:hypothetical protein CJF30_00009642 [Rutstroemia sp. NJR-2017a BBW]|nr:hypothetical protein CJF30_00009642 [Rutstroemia sp. NJR-2017a BBW]
MPSVSIRTTRWRGRSKWRRWEPYTRAAQECSSISDLILCPLMDRNATIRLIVAFTSLTK